MFLIRYQTGMTDTMNESDSMRDHRRRNRGPRCSPHRGAKNLNYWCARITICGGDWMKSPRATSGGWTRTSRRRRIRPRWSAGSRRKSCSTNRGAMIWRGSSNRLVLTRRRAGAASGICRRRPLTIMIWIPTLRYGCSKTREKKTKGWSSWIRNWNSSLMSLLGRTRGWRRICRNFMLIGSGCGMSWLLRKKFV